MLLINKIMVVLGNQVLVQWPLTADLDNNLLGSDLWVGESLSLSLPV